MTDSTTLTGTIGHTAGRYRGRFAPTPSGPLHLGSLLTALASWLCARTVGGVWLLRVDDLDRERCDPASTAQILGQLDAHGLHWDETPRYQSEHLEAYMAALECLRVEGRLYACDCSRTQLRERGQPGREGRVYDGRCRQRQRALAAHAWRLRVDPQERSFEDGWQGRQHCRMDVEIGDFAVRRRDGTIAYQLACAVDEHAQAITDVVRGADLLASTFMQLQVSSALGFNAPAYRHLPVLVTEDGRKLSKQNHAPPIEIQAAASNLCRCLQWLGQAPPDRLHTASVAEVLGWALAHWQADRVPRTTCIKVERAP